MISAVAKLRKSDSFTNESRKKLVSLGAGALDELLVSASTLILMLILARSLNAADFGSFTILYTYSLFGTAVQTATITQPHHIIYQGLTPDVQREYTSGLLSIQIALAISTGLVLVIARAMSLLSGLSWTIAGYSLLFIFLSQLQEFTRRMLFSSQRRSSALLTDLTQYGIQFTLILALWHIDQLTLSNSLLALAAAAGSGALFGTTQMWNEKLSIKPKLARIRHAWTLNLEQARWLLPSTLLGFFSLSAIPVMSAAVLSTSAIGAYRAMQSLLGLSNVAVRIADTSLSPVASKTLQTSSVKALNRFLALATTAAVPFLLIPTILISFYPEQILSIAFGGTYSEFSEVLPPLALATFLVVLQTPLIIGLRAMHSTRAVFTARLISLVAGLTGYAALRIHPSMLVFGQIQLITALIPLVLLLVSYYKAGSSYAR